MSTRAFQTDILLSITTGRLLCEFSDMHQCAEYLAGEPVWTHQFAYKAFNDELAKAVLSQHPDLADVDPETITTENWEARRAEFIRRFGPTRKLTPIRGGAKTTKAAMVEPLRGKKVIVVRASGDGSAGEASQVEPEEEG